MSEEIINAFYNHPLTPPQGGGEAGKGFAL